MSESNLSREVLQEIRRRVFEEAGFVKLTQVVRRGGVMFRVSLRPITLRGELCYQGEMSEGGETTLKNFTPDEARGGLEEILAQAGQRELHLITASGDLHVRVTRKGRELVSRSAPQEREVEEAPAHDRVKRQPLNSFDATALLKAINIADADGRIKASMRGKYDQINEFLRVLDTTLKEKPEDVFKIVDAECGRAYLTLASYFYLTQVRGFDVRICGIDRKKQVVETARKLAVNLAAAESVSFVEGELASADPGFEPDMVVSLHACDTATDEALARGVEWRSRYLLCAPCCQHELHTALKGGGALQGMLRHGIIRERLADLLTDTFRAQILRILGFRVGVFEFVGADATARNTMLRAEYGVKRGQQGAVSEYLELKEVWGVTPWLEGRLAGKLGRYLESYD